MVGHERLALGDPDVPQTRDVLPLLFKRLQVFFCATVPAGAAADRLRSDAHSAHVLSPAPPSIRQSSGRAAPRPGLPCVFGSSAPVSRWSRTISLTNLIETHSHRAVSVCVFPCSTSATARSLSSIGCGFPISDPHIYLRGKESQNARSGNSESDQDRHALSTYTAPMSIQKNNRFSMTENHYAFSKL